MAAQGRIKTKYPGVYYTEGKSTTGKPIRRYYVVFKRDGKVYEEAAKVLVDGGPDTRPAETPQEASAWRSRRIAEVTSDKGEARPQLTVGQIWERWSAGRKGARGFPSIESRYNIHVGRFFGAKVAEEICNFDVTRFRHVPTGSTAPVGWRTGSDPRSRPAFRLSQVRQSEDRVHDP